MRKTIETKIRLKTCQYKWGLMHTTSIGLAVTEWDRGTGRRKRQIREIDRFQLGRD